MASGATVGDRAPSPIPARVDVASAPTELLLAPVRWARLRRRAPALVVVTLYVGLAVWATAGAWWHGAGHVVNAGGAGDIGEEIWFLAAPTRLALAGHSPFFTNWLNYPSGVNLMANTAMPLPALLVAPVTLLFGPIASFTTLLVVGLASSATAAFAVIRRWARWTPAAFLGGLLYGFGPFMSLEGSGHLFLVLAPVPPLVLLALDEILVRQRGRPGRWGAGLGLLLAAQLLVSAEVLGGIVVFAVLGILVVAVSRRRQRRPWGRHALVAGASAVVVFGALSAYPLWVFFAGRAHVHGPAQPLKALDHPVDLLGVVVPAGYMALHAGVPGHLAATLGGHENGAYLGGFLVVALAAVAWRGRRLAVVRWATVMTVVSLVLTLGPTLQVDGRRTGIPLPFQALTHVPVLDSLVPARFAMFTALFAGLLLAVGVDRARAGGGAAASARRGRAGLLALSGAAVALAPLAPAWPYPTAAVDLPPFFATAAHQGPAGGTLLAYPFPRGPEHVQAMIWQAVDGMRYRMPGGYVITPTAKGTATFSGEPSLTEEVFEISYQGRPLPAWTRGVFDRLGRDLRRWDVGTIVIADVGARPQVLVALYAALLGAPPKVEGGVDVWFEVQRLLRHATFNPSAPV